MPEKHPPKTTNIRKKIAKQLKIKKKKKIKSQR